MTFHKKYATILFGKLQHISMNGTLHTELPQSHTKFAPESTYDSGKSSVSTGQISTPPIHTELLLRKNENTSTTTSKVPLKEKFVAVYEVLFMV